MTTVSILEQLEVYPWKVTGNLKEDLNVSSEIDNRWGIEGNPPNADISDRHSLVREKLEIISLM